MEDEIKTKCVKCNKEIEQFFGIQNTNIAFPCLKQTKLYANDDMMFGFCGNSDCENFNLMQFFNN